MCIRYNSIETNEAVRIGYNGFLFPNMNDAMPMIMAGDIYDK